MYKYYYHFTWTSALIVFCFAGFCTTQDVDIFLRHMNNARYVRELDFARFHFYDRTGIYQNIKAVDGHVLQGASSIRYRRTIPIFSAYKVETKVSILYDNLWTEHNVKYYLIILCIIVFRTIVMYIVLFINSLKKYNVWNNVTTNVITLKW